MSFHLYPFILFFTVVLQFTVSLISLYALLFSQFRWLWTIFSIAMLLMLTRQTFTLVGAWAEPIGNNSQWLVAILELSISSLVLVGLALRLPAEKELNLRLKAANLGKKALVESEEKYRALIDSTNAGYFIIDEKGVVLECNDTYVQLTGRNNIDEVVGHNLAEWVFRPRPGDYILNEVSKHRSQELKKYDGTTYQHPDGQQIPVEVFSRGLISKDGLCILALARDVSEREEARKKLVASEKQGNLLFENSPISTAIFTPDGQFVRANKAHDELWGFVLSEVAPDFNILKDPQTNERIGKDRLAAIFKGAEIALEPFVYKASELGFKRGRNNTVLPMFFPLFDDQGAVESIVQMHIDLTERVAAEQQLREREAFYRALIESTNDGYALLEPDETVIDANAEYIRLTGHRNLTEIKGQISRQ